MVGPGGSLPRLQPMWRYWCARCLGSVAWKRDDGKYGVMIAYRWRGRIYHWFTRSDGEQTLFDTVDRLKAKGQP